MEFRPPDSLVTCPGCVLSFFCLVKGWPFWKIDGVYVNVGVVNSYEMNGFTFNEKLNKTSGIYNMTMTVEATLDNNDTYIQCSAGPNVESPNVTIIVAGELKLHAMMIAKRECYNPLFVLIASSAKGSL